MAYNDKYGEDADVHGIATRAAETAVSGIREELRETLNAIKGSQQITAAKVDAQLRGKVTAPGYTEEFSDYKLAAKEYEKIKKRMAKNSTAGVVKLFTEDPQAGRAKWVLLAKWNANEDAFE